MPKLSPRSSRRLEQLRVGFVPVVDCAPLVVAREKGFFAESDLDVKLCRELGWATVREKVIYGELDAAQAVAGMAMAATCGWGSIAMPCVTGLILNTNGNGITLSNLLYAQGVRDGETFKEYLVSDAKSVPTLGTVSPFSSHNFLLRRWLRASRIDPDKDVRIVIVPPPQVCQNLEAGNLDGFCVGEPWNTLAVQKRIGWSVATSLDLSRGHPEKILIVREQFALRNPEQHLALIAALLKACRWCDGAENLAELAAMLARPEYLDLPARVLLPSLSGEYDYGNGRREAVENFFSFSREGANDPSPKSVGWIADNLVDNGFTKVARPSAQLCERVFRRDLYRQAQQLASASLFHEKPKMRKTNETVRS